MRGRLKWWQSWKLSRPSTRPQTSVRKSRRCDGSFRQLVCVQGRCRLADERLAADRHRAGVESVQPAILLDRVCKSMSLLDRPRGEPVCSLRYFASLVGEVLTVSFPDSYWPHSEFTLNRCERIQGGPKAPITACLSLA